MSKKVYRLSNGFFSDIFIVFIDMAKFLPCPQSLDNPALSSPYALLLPQAQVICDHGDELRIRGLALDVRHRAAEEAPQDLGTGISGGSGA